MEIKDAGTLSAAQQLFANVKAAALGTLGSAADGGAFADLLDIAAAPASKPEEAKNFAPVKVSAPAADKDRESGLVKKKDGKADASVKENRNAKKEKAAARDSGAGSVAAENAPKPDMKEKNGAAEAKEGADKIEAETERDSSSAASAGGAAESAGLFAALAADAAGPAEAEASQVGVVEALALAEPVAGPAETVGQAALPEEFAAVEESRPEPDMQGELAAKGEGGEFAAAAPKAPENEQVSRQAERIAEMVGAGRKLKIEVSVERDAPLKTSAGDLLAAGAASESELASEAGEARAMPEALVSPEAREAAPSAVRPQVLQAMDNAALAFAAAAVQASVAEQAASAAEVAASAEAAAAPQVSVEAFASSFAAAEAKSGSAAPEAKPAASFREIFKGLSSEVVEQVKVNIVKSAVRGLDKIEITLRPRELGTVEVKIELAKDGRIAAHVVASRAETMEILQKDSAALEKALADAGFDTASGSLSFSLREGDRDGSGAEADRLRAFIGRAIEAEEAELGTNIASDAWWDGKSALNIRV